MAMANLNQQGEDEWILTDAEYRQLKEDSDFLAALEAAGVDNWEGYSVALREMDEVEEDCD